MTKIHTHQTGLRGWWKERCGGTAIEFALVFPVFLLFFSGILEIGLITWGNSIIANNMEQAARRASVGCVDFEINSGNCKQDYTVEPRYIRKTIEQRSVGFVRACDQERFKFAAKPVDATGSEDFEIETSDGVDFGTEGRIVVYKATYQWPTFIPLLRTEYFGNFINFTNTVVIRNEKFGDIPGRHIGSGGGC